MQKSYRKGIYFTVERHQVPTLDDILGNSQKSQTKKVEYNSFTFQTPSLSILDRKESTSLQAEDLSLNYRQQTNNHTNIFTNDQKRQSTNSHYSPYSFNHNPNYNSKNI